jgi:hypothetical protein
MNILFNAKNVFQSLDFSSFTLLSGEQHWRSAL